VNRSNWPSTTGQEGPFEEYADFSVVQEGSLITANCTDGGFPASQLVEEIMPTGKHYFIERTQEGRFAVRAWGGFQATKVLDNEDEAVALVKKLNPDDRPIIARKPLSIFQLLANCF
jgi:hypothetical protein